jgi:hypothetical protein
MDAIGGHHVKCSKPGSETQKLYVFSHSWKIDSKKSIYTKISMIIHELDVEFICNSGTTLWNSESE